MVEVGTAKPVATNVTKSLTPGVIQKISAQSELPPKAKKNINEQNIGYFKEHFVQSIWWRYLLAGGSAGAVSRTGTAPMDRVKIFTQVHPHKMSLLNCLKFLIHENGVQSLWRGNGVNVLKVVPESAIKFTAYEKAKRLQRGDVRRALESRERFLAGATAGGISQTIVFPLEVIKVRLASQVTFEYAGMRETAQKMLRYEGVRSFYRGYVPMIMGSLPYSGIEFTTYEALKGCCTLNHGEDVTFLELICCSCTSSLIGQCCIYPLTLARTRLQSGIVGDITLLEVFRRILKKEGVRGLYRGISANICKVLPAVTINFLVYEYLSRYLGIRMT